MRMRWKTLSSSWPGIVLKKNRGGIMNEIDNYYSRVNSVRDIYGRLAFVPEGVEDADDKAEIAELERLRKEVARKRRREEIEALRRELRRDPFVLELSTNCLCRQLN